MGNRPQLGEWQPGKIKMNRSEKNIWTITLNFNAGDVLEYKYTLGDWAKVEKNHQGNEIDNRTLLVNGNAIQNDTVQRWAIDFTNTVDYTDGNFSFNQKPIPIEDETDLSVDKTGMFEHITTKDGLSQSYIRCILKDSQGFMWFGTGDGLNRYDGYNFTVYKYDSNNPNSISSNSIMAICEDRDGYILGRNFGWRFE